MRIFRLPRQGQILTKTNPHPVSGGDILYTGEVFYIDLVGDANKPKFAIPSPLCYHRPILQNTQGGDPMLKKLYDRSELWFAIAWIVAYVVLASAGDNFSQALGTPKLVTLPILAVLSAGLFFFVRKHGLRRKYGLGKPQTDSAGMLYYAPLILLLTANLWYGVGLNQSPLETVLYILSMVCVGFLEELIFRGLLFQAMAKDGGRAAIVVPV